MDKKTVIIIAASAGGLILLWVLWQAGQPSASAAQPAASSPSGSASATSSTASNQGAQIAQTNGAVQVAAPTVASPVPSQPVVANSAVTAQGPVSQSNPTTITPGMSLTAANGSVQVPAAVVTWFSTVDAANQAQILAMLPTMTANDISGLDDLIVNDWNGNGVTTATQRAFWNAWRVQYHILDGTYA